MNKYLAAGIVGVVLFVLLIGIAFVFVPNDKTADQEPVIIIEKNFLYYDGVNITWHGVAAFKLKTRDLVVYIDPYLLASDAERADIVIATHDHYDHLSVPDIRIIADINTILYTPKPAQVDQFGTALEEVESLKVKEISYTKPWDTLEESDITIEFIPAYNDNHPRDANWTGVIVDFGNVRIYHAGDTAQIPEIKQIDCDIALLPILGTGLMSDEEGAEVVESLQVLSDLQYAIPMHYTYPVTIGNMTIGNLIEVEDFQERANCTVIILEPIF
ncbi:MAG: MBL fold metallo-hydrolase [Candidatus Heimdallarchaeota archaeon]|nr:MAG: MBL fold metallo-hydrolase [Candidatus Heimdallarchaeota archaeon]